MLSSSRGDKEAKQRVGSAFFDCPVPLSCHRRSDLMLVSNHFEDASLCFRIGVVGTTITTTLPCLNAVHFFKNGNVSRNYSGEDQCLLFLQKKCDNRPKYPLVGGLASAVHFPVSLTSGAPLIEVLLDMDDISNYFVMSGHLFTLVVAIA
jgi:hypothetical protein